MELNPHKQEYKRLQSVLSDTRTRKTKFSDELSWFEGTNIGSLHLSVERNNEKKKNLLIYKNTVESDIDRLQKGIKEAKRHIGPSLILFTGSTPAKMPLGLN